MNQGRTIGRARYAAWKARLAARFLRAGRQDRGDVPGWVLVTMMSAGLVIILWAAAGGLLSELFTDAVKGVKGP
ncbi:hypothetical protein ATL41_0802 [Flavimobilis soli]|uniref:Flp pilus assembly pilin Flp n=1 Tax=Flavimobilis soli TaxID=442709 RepID=A0A2A9EBA9_9MICO|nr:hypothetical protein [Flavimobilis soli]PFG36093.1 hypothetical protein ATL41_0802 [Flavimobilis soli]